MMYIYKNNELLQLKFIEGKTTLKTKVKKELNKKKIELVVVRTVLTTDHS